MKRVVSIILTLAMLLLALGGFGACARDVQKVELKGFSVLYPKNTLVSDTFIEQVNQFAARIEAVTGEPVEVISESNEAELGEKVILIGETTREESQNAKTSIEGNGFVWRASKEQIVIVGNTPVMTMYAMQCFAEEYLGETTSKKIKIAKNYEQFDLPVFEVVSEGESKVSFVYESSLDTEEGNKWAEPDSVCNYDYPYQAFLDCIAKLEKLTGVNQKKFVKKADTAPSTDGEILIGMPDREETSECLSQLEAEQAGVFVCNNKLVVTAYGDSSLTKAHEMFLNLIGDALIVNSDGSKSVLFPTGFSAKTTCFDGFVTDFPRPDGVSLYNTQDVGDGSLQYLYIGEGVNQDAFRAYTEKLKGNGYTLLCENEIEDSLFATFVNEQAQHTLYVAYNDFKHGKSNYNYKARLKVISAPLSAVNLFDEEILTENPTYEKKSDASITALSLKNEAVGMGYVIMLEDGRFVIFDGGRYDDSAKRLWETLNGLYERANGHSPNTHEPIEIAAWVITHSHSDHFDTFQRFVNLYGYGGKVKIDYVLGNFPSASVAFNAAGKDMSFAKGVYALAENIPGCKYIRVHTGERYYFANLEIEVLYTQEDANPIRLDLFNDTSCTMRFTMNATDANGKKVENKEATVTSIWTGDAFIYGSRFMTAMYGSYLESDMVQVAHHGNVGCESPFYNCIKPTAIWFPHVYSAFRSYTGGWRTDWQSKVDRDLVVGIGSVAYAFVSDVNCVTVPLRTSGADYDGIFDAITGEAISYTEFGESTASAAVKIK